MSARERLAYSLQALLHHIDSGGIQDTALPGTPASEATRLLKNGLSVSAFACFEHFVRERTAELLGSIASDAHLPAFHQLPTGLQVAATKGVVEALRFRLGARGETLDAASVVALTQEHAAAIASSKHASYVFSDWTFGYSTSNVGPATLRDFLTACGAPHFVNEIGGVLRDVDFDYAAAGLAERSNLKLSRIAAWRHEAAHDATLSIDIQILRTRITAYLAVGFAFDLLGSLAVRVLIDSFGPYGHCTADRSYMEISHLRPDQGDFELQKSDGAALGRYYSVTHCQTALCATEMPLDGAVVVRDAQGQIVDWFFR